jgi:hypothetical protein
MRMYVIAEGIMISYIHKENLTWKAWTSSIAFVTFQTDQGWSAWLTFLTREAIKAWQTCE